MSNDILKELIHETLIFLTESDKDVQQLIKINANKARKLLKRKEDEDVRSYEKRVNDWASKGYVPKDDGSGLDIDLPFDVGTLHMINGLADSDVPTNDRKRFILWLANSEHGRHLYNSHDFARTCRYIADWINSSGTDEYINMSFRDAFTTAVAWHVDLTRKQNDELTIEGDKIVHSFDNGYTIAEVKPENLDNEGCAMGHCVGGYTAKVEQGSSKIFSLRDAKKRPHVTIEVETDTGNVIQVEGKQNKPPIEKYAVMVKEWLKTTDYNIPYDIEIKLMTEQEQLQVIDDSISLNSEDDVLNLYELARFTSYPVVYKRLFDECMALAKRDNLSLLEPIRSIFVPLMAHNPNISLTANMMYEALSNDYFMDLVLTTELLRWLERKLYFANEELWIKWTSQAYKRKHT